MNKKGIRKSKRLQQAESIDMVTTFVKPTNDPFKPMWYALQSSRIQSIKDYIPIWKSELRIALLSFKFEKTYYTFKTREYIKGIEIK